uniref:Ig-like domain-containing protein n=1 Tax=Cyprinus carpio TaxID=7962 RepID=A0A8C2BUS9_CYPCA
MNFNIISYADAGCELGGSNAVRGGFTQHFNSSAVRSHTAPLKKMFHKFVLFCLCCWGLTGVFGESVSVTEGDSVTLNTNVTEIHKRDTIMWKYGAGKSKIATMSKKKQNNSCDFPDGRFRDRLKLDNQTGSLTITNITSEHAGLYELDISGAKKTLKSFNVSVYARLPVPVISSNSSNCSSSSSSSYCSLVCSVVNVSHVTLSWYTGNSLLSSISVSDLSISLSLLLEVEYQDKNSYSCVINNPISNQTQHLDISQLCHTCSGTAAVICVFTVVIRLMHSLTLITVSLLFYFSSFSFSDSSVDLCFCCWIFVDCSCSRDLLHLQETQKNC